MSNLEKIVQYCYAHKRHLNSWEQGFMKSIVRKEASTLTPKQREVLLRIREKIKRKKNPRRSKVRRLPKIRFVSGGLCNGK